MTLDFVGRQNCSGRVKPKRNSFLSMSHCCLVMYLRMIIMIIISFQSPRNHRPGPSALLPLSLYAKH